MTWMREGIWIRGAGPWRKIEQRCSRCGLRLLDTKFRVGETRVLACAECEWMGTEPVSATTQSRKDRS